MSTQTPDTQVEELLSGLASDSAKRREATALKVAKQKVTDERVINRLQYLAFHDPIYYVRDAAKASIRALGLQVDYTPVIVPATPTQQTAVTSSANIETQASEPVSDSSQTTATDLSVLAAELRAKNFSETEIREALVQRGATLGQADDLVRTARQEHRKAERQAGLRNVGIGVLLMALGLLLYGAIAIVGSIMFLVGMGLTVAGLQKIF